MTVTQLESMEVAVPPTLVAQIEGVTCAPDAIGPSIGQAFGRLYAAIGRAGLRPGGPPRAIYTAWNPNEIRFDVASPVDRAPATPLDSGGVAVKTLPGRVALRFVHHGPYRTIRETYGRIESFLRERGGIKTPADWAKYCPMWEEYVNDPAVTPETELETRIFLHLRDQ